MEPRRLLRVLAVGMALLAGCAPAAVAAEPLTAPPASAGASAACAARAAASAKDADVARVVAGRVMLGGCITDSSGIAHLFVEWRSEEGATGRICVDPPVRRVTWRCTWDTTRLEPGSYRVTMIAVDPAGNRGSSDQAYRVEAAAPPRAQAEPGERDDPPAVDDAAGVEPGGGAAGGTATAPSDGAAQGETDTTRPAAPAPERPDETTPSPVVPEPTPTPPPASGDRTMLASFVQERTAECARLELAPGVRADRALSVAVLDCMRPALEALGATALTLDEIPVPPAIEMVLADGDARARATELLPDWVGGVELKLVPAPDPAAAGIAEPGAAEQPDG